ncbi:MAG: metal ABC transporter permease [Calditrichota bacterium]
MIETLQMFITDYTLRNVALGAILLGVISGALGSFAVLRKQSLLGDTISHAALPGIAIAFLLTGSKSSLILLIGAALSGWLATLFMMMVVRHTRIKTDSALGIMLSVFFGFGLMLLTYIQKLPDANQAGLEKFLFGQAATVLAEDVKTMAIFGAFVLFGCVLFWKELKILSFDEDFGTSQGLNMRYADMILTTLLVIAIVVGLQMVGVVLMSAMVVAPAAAARQWTNRLHIMVILAAFFGALAGLGGAVTSSLIPNLPTGPTIVLAISGIVIVSLFFSPNRGLFWRWLRQMRNRQDFHIDAVLLDLYALALQHPNLKHAHAVGVLKTMNLRQSAVEHCLRELKRRGMALQKRPGLWGLTQAGIDRAKELMNPVRGDER